MKLKRKVAATKIAAVMRGNASRVQQRSMDVAATRIAAAVRGRQAKRATWKRVKSLQALAVAGLAAQREEGSASAVRLVEALESLPVRPQRRIFSAIYYERPIGLILRSGDGGETKVSAVSGASADQGVPVGAVVIEVNEEPAEGLGRSAVAALISSASLPLEIRLDMTDTSAASVMYMSFPEGMLGFNLVFPTDGRVLVSSVERDSLAADRGVTVGSELLEINRETVHGLGRDAVIDRIRSSQRPMALKLDVAQRDCHSVVTATFPDGPIGLGLHFPPDGRCVVASVEPGGHGERQGVPVGAAIIDVNRQTLRGLGRERSLAIIAQSARPMLARVDITGAKILTAVFPTGRLGLHVTFPSSGLVLVSAVDDGSVAADQGVPVGASILEINGQPMRGLGRDAVTVVLETAPRPLQLKIDISGGSIYSATFDEGPLGFTFDFTSDGRALVSQMEQGGAAADKGVTVGSALLTVNDTVAGGLSEDAVLDLIGAAERPLTLRFDLTGGRPVASHEHAGLGRLAPPTAEEAPASAPAAALQRAPSQKQVASQRVRRLSLGAANVELIEKKVQQELRMSMASSCTSFPRGSRTSFPTPRGTPRGSAAQKSSMARGGDVGSVASSSPSLANLATSSGSSAAERQTPRPSLSRAMSRASFMNRRSGDVAIDITDGNARSTQTSTRRPERPPSARDHSPPHLFLSFITHLGSPPLPPTTPN